MKQIFEFTSYRKYLEDWIGAQESLRYGLKGQIAKALRISSSLVSQILKGEKNFTPEQASDLADFIGLIEIEADYLSLLVEFERAGSPRYREKLKRKIESLQKKSKQIGNRVPRHQEMTDEQKAIYYSSWLYTGIRNLTALSEFDQLGAIAKHFQLEPAVVNRVLQFLLAHGLCKEQNGKITYGPASIHIDKDSPYVNKHHQNWRFQSIHHMEKRREDDLFFTSPMSLSREAYEEVQKVLLATIQNVMKVSGPSPSEMVACMNIDFFEY